LCLNIYVVLAKEYDDLILKSIHLRQAICRGHQRP